MEREQKGKREGWGEGEREGCRVNKEGHNSNMKSDRKKNPLA